MVCLYNIIFEYYVIYTRNLSFLKDQKSEKKSLKNHKEIMTK